MILLHAYHAHETQESQYNFTLMLADQDFDIARGLGLAFKDNAVISGFTYRYIISLNNLSQYNNLYGNEEVSISDSLSR